MSVFACFIATENNWSTETSPQTERDGDDLSTKFFQRDNYLNIEIIKLVISKEILFHLLLCNVHDHERQ